MIQFGFIDGTHKHMYIKYKMYSGQQNGAAPVTFLTRHSDSVISVQNDCGMLVNL